MIALNIFKMEKTTCPVHTIPSIELFALSTKNTCKILAFSFKIDKNWFTCREKLKGTYLFKSVQDTTMPSIIDHCIFDILACTHHPLGCVTHTSVHTQTSTVLQ